MQILQEKPQTQERKSTWTRNCKVFVRLNGASPEEEKLIVIREINDLELYDET